MNAAPALRVEGIIRHPPLEQPLEYFVIIAIRNDRGEEVTRQVVNVGALQAAEKRTFTLSVEVLPPAIPVPTKSAGSGSSVRSTLAQPSATVRPPAPPLGGAPGGGSTPAAGGAPGSGTPASEPGSASGSTAPKSGYPGGLKPPVPGGPKRH